MAIRDALGSKAEVDADLKGDYSGLKNTFDNVEKDFATWSKPVAPIDWNKYSNAIEVPGFVDFMKVRGKRLLPECLPVYADVALLAVVLTCSLLGSWPACCCAVQAKYEGIDWNAFSTKLSDAEVAADASEKEALVRMEMRMGRWSGSSMNSPSIRRGISTQVHYRVNFRADAKEALGRMDG